MLHVTRLTGILHDNPRNASARSRVNTSTIRFSENNDENKDRRMIRAGVTRAVTMLGLLLGSITAINWGTLLNTPAKADQTAAEKPAQVKPKDPPALPILVPLSGKVELGTQGDWEIKKEKTTYNLQGITPECKREWFKVGTKAVVVTRTKLRENTPINVYKILPANLTMDPPVKDIGIGNKATVMQYSVVGTIESYDEKAQTATIKDEKTGTVYPIKELTPDRLEAWLQPNVLIDLRGKMGKPTDEQKKKNIVPFHVTRILPVAKNDNI